MEGHASAWPYVKIADAQKHVPPKGPFSKWQHGFGFKKNSLILDALPEHKKGAHRGEPLLLIRYYLIVLVT